MKIFSPENSIGTKQIVINQGEIYVSDKQEIISTLLGSCVAACLYDPITKITGMNHFLLADNNFNNKNNLFDMNAGKFGIYAMEQLIDRMLKKGAVKKNLKAKCFGGGNVLHTQSNDLGPIKNVCQLNIDFIKKFLKTEKIELVNSSLGGDHGRKIHFFGDDQSVYVQKILIGSKGQVTNNDKIYCDERELKFQASRTKNSNNNFW